METFLSSWKNYHQYDDKVKAIYLEAMKEQFSEYYQYIPRNYRMGELMAETIKNKIEEGWNKQDILDAYCMCEDLADYFYSSIIGNPIIPEIENLQLENKDETIETVEELLEEASRYIVATNSEGQMIRLYPDFKLDEPEGELLQWRPPQIEAINAVLESNFANGIICHTVGVGKSFTALHLAQLYHQRNFNKNILIITERVSILQDLFTANGQPDLNKYQDWFNKGIIKMDEFVVVDMVNNVGRKHWIDKINQEYDKPKFVIANRAFLTTISLGQPKYRYINESFGLVIYDEVHGIMANEAYKFMVELMLTRGTKILGFSATPIREGKATNLLNMNFNYLERPEEIVEYNPETMIERLRVLFTKDDKLNIYSICTARDAISMGILVPPVFHWMGVQKAENNVDMFSEEEKLRIMNSVSKIVPSLAYKKIIAWGRTKNNARNLQKFWNEYRSSFNYLEDLECYLQTSESSNRRDYEKFYSANEGIMFCPMMHREGSDIPKLSVAMFLDKVKKRGDIPTIQSIGRVLRSDPEGLKKEAHIFDFFQFNNEEECSRFYADKLLKYYFNLVDIANNREGTSESKVMQYLRLIESVKFNPKTSTVDFAISENQNIRIDLGEINLTELEWHNIEKNFSRLYRQQLEFDRQDEFALLKTNVQMYHFNNPDAYRRSCGQLEFPMNPEVDYDGLWKGWYDFFGLDKPQMTHEEWMGLVERYEIRNADEYNSLADVGAVPMCPEELYEFSDLQFELTNLNRIDKSFF